MLPIAFMGGRGWEPLEYGKSPVHGLGEHHFKLNAQLKAVGTTHIITSSQRHQPSKYSSTLSSPVF